MGTKQAPGRNDCYARALPDEPMFVLLARDPDFACLIEAWANIRANDIRSGERPESDMELVQEARQCAQHGATWRKNNMGKWREPQPKQPEQPSLKDALRELIALRRGEEWPQWMHGESEYSGWDVPLRKLLTEALTRIEYLEGRQGRDLTLNEILGEHPMEKARSLDMGVAYDKPMVAEAMEAIRSKRKRNVTAMLRDFKSGLYPALQMRVDEIIAKVQEL